LLLIPWLFLAANAIAVMVVGLARQDIPAGFWTAQREWWIVGALMTTAVVPFLQFLFTDRGEKARRRALERERRINAILAGALVQAVKRAGADWEQTGLQAFAVRKRRLHRDDQTRVGKVRLSSLASSGVRWTKGKGVIGRCWERQRHHVADLQSHFQQYLDWDEARWNTLAHDVRYGLAFDEFEKMKDKYGVVAAVPVVDRRDQYIGCVTADFPPGAPSAAINRDELLGVLAGAAVLVGQILAE
jgi:hypothetical protein